MKKNIFAILLLFNCIWSQNATLEKILFIGNSFTFYWNLPLVVESMANERGYNFDIIQSTVSSSSLKDHWFENNELKSRTLISNSEFNRVVIQDYSNNPLQNSKESQKYFLQFIDHIKLNNGTPYIYTTWMYKGITSNNYDVLDPMHHTLKPLADKTGAILVPVDQAFRIFQQRYPTIPIFTMDSKHPSPVGTYLAACVFYRLFTGDSPLGLSRRYERKDESGKKFFLGMVEKSTAIKCQKIVDEILPQ
tara:strand:- start:52 stop:798 length:747 start_codon:yes stop_codon:yes gene_type:complete